MLSNRVNGTYQMKDISEGKKKSCIFANLSLVLLLTAVLLFAYALSEFSHGSDTTSWIGGGLVFLAFPMGLFSLIRIYRHKTRLAGKKRAWAAVIVGFVLFILCLFAWWVYEYNISFSDGGC